MRVCVSLLTGFCEFSCVAEAALQASDSVQSSHGHFSSLSLNPPPGQVCTEQTEDPLPCLGHFYNNKNMFYLCNFIFDTTNSKIIQICLVLNEQGNTLFLENITEMLLRISGYSKYIIINIIKYYLYMSVLFFLYQICIPPVKFVCLTVTPLQPSVANMLACSARIAISTTR